MDSCYTDRIHNNLLISVRIEGSKGAPEPPGLSGSNFLNFQAVFGKILAK